MIGAALAGALTLGDAPHAYAQQAPGLLAPDLTAAVAHGEQSRPILVNRFEQTLGFRFKAESRGTHGTVYRLSRATRVGQQQVQLGFDLDGRPKIARLVMEISDNGMINRLAIGDAMKMMAKALRPGWAAAPKIIDETLAHAFDSFSRGMPDQVYAVETEAFNDKAALRIYPARMKASFDIRPRLPVHDLLTRDEALALLTDATLRLEPTDGSPAYVAYHAPDRLLSGQATGRESVDTGTWRIGPDGAYCVEFAPQAGWRCSTIVADDAGGYALMEMIEGRATGKIVAAARISPGNPHGLFVARVGDILPPEMVVELTAEHTEQRRKAGTENTVTAYFRSDGSFKEGPEMGRWNVLQDGRRCWKVDEPDPGPWRCAFLRETDGGTFAFLDESGDIIAEALIEEGNPRNW